MGGISGSTMRRLRMFHLYIGVFITPMVIMFCLSGIWQAFRLHESKNEAYEPPALLKVVSAFHKVGKLKGDQLLNPSPPYRWFVSIIGVSIAVSSCLGVLMAWRVSGSSRVLFLLAGGITIPLLLLVLGSLRN